MKEFCLLFVLTPLSLGELRQGSLCDPEGTVREFTIFEKVVHGAAHKKCVCQVGYYGRYCERIHSCTSGRPMAVNCTDPPKVFEAAIEARCAIGPDRELDVCLCFTGYKGNRCEQTINEGHSWNYYNFVGNKQPPVADSEEDYDPSGGRLVILPSDGKFSTQQDEEMAAMESRFWYLAFCLALSAVIAILLIGLYFLVVQTIYKAGLRHLSERELRRRLRPGYVKARDDSLSLPPPYYEDEERKLVEETVEINEETRPSTSGTVNLESGVEETVVEELPQYRQLYVHV